MIALWLILAVVAVAAVLFLVFRPERLPFRKGDCVTITGDGYYQGQQGMVSEIWDDSFGTGYRYVVDFGEKTRLGFSRSIICRANEIQKIS